MFSEATVDTNSKDYKQGYDDAIKAFKEMMKQAKKGNTPNSGSSSSSGQQAPMPGKLLDDAKKELSPTPNSRFTTIWFNYVKFVVPVIILVIFISNM